MKRFCALTFVAVLLASVAFGAVPGGESTEPVQVAQATSVKAPTANAPTSTLAHRLDCRIALRIARAGATAADQANIDKVTASPAGIDLLATALAGEHDAQPQLGASANGTIQTFIQFLLANLPAIISAIESIIAALSL